MHHSKPAASSASFDAGSQHDHNLLLHNRVEHDEVSDLILDQDEDHAASPLHSYYESSGPGTVERKSATPGASPSVSSVLMSAIGGAFPMDDDFAPHSSSSSFDIGYPNFSSFGSGSSSSSGGLDEHDLQFSSSPLHFPSHSRHTAPASSQLQPLHAPQHRPPRDLDATQASQQASIDEEAKEIIARLYVASARPSPAWFEQHQCGSILHVTTSDAASSTSSPSSEPMSIEMEHNGSPSHITSRTVVVVLEHRSGDVASLGSSLKHAADVVHETLGLDPKRSVLLRAGAASDGGDESEQQQQHEAEEHEVVAATAMAYLVAGAKLSLRVAVEQLTTVLGSDRVQRMGDGFKRQLMAIETHVSRRPPSHDFFAPPSPTANVEAVASAPAPTQSGPATTQPATKAIKADGPDGWSSVSEGATNKMVVLSSSHPALPADASVSSSTSTQSSLRPPTSAPQASSVRSPQQSAPSTPMLSPRSSSSQPTSPNPYGESDSPPDSAGGKRPRTESSSSKEQPPSKRRGPYRCGRCGMPKRGHSCPESSKGQDGPSAQSPAVSTPNTSSLSSCPSTPAAPVVVATVPAKAELPPPASLPPSASCTDTSSTPSLCSSTSAAATATVATASDESAANAAGTPSAGPSGPSASAAAAAASPVSPSYDELMSKIAELIRDRDYYMNRYLALLQDGAADHLPSGEQLQLHQQRAVKLGVSSVLSTPDRRQPQPQQQQGLAYPSPSRSSLADHQQQQQQRYHQQQQPGSVVHSPASAHSPSHPLPIGPRYQPQQKQYYPQQQQHTHHALMRTSSTGDSAGGAAYSSPSSSPYLTRHVGSSRSGLVSSSPAATTTTAGGGRFTIGRFGPDASGFYSPSHHHRTTREPNGGGGGGAPFHFSSPSFAHSSSTVATHPTQQLALPHFANPTAGAASLEDQQQPQAGQQSSTSSVVSPSLGTSSSPLSLKAAEDFFYWDDFCASTNG